MNVIEVFQGKTDNLWYFHFVDDGNHKILAASEGYEHRDDAMTTALSIIDETRHEIRIIGA